MVSRATLISSWTSNYSDICAESDAIISALRQHADLTNCLLYTTTPPCNKCAQMIVQSGIKTVVYGKKNGHQVDEKAMDIFYWGKIAIQ